MWVTDARNNRLQLFNPKGEFVSALENNGSLNLNQPWGLDLNVNDEIYVANTKSNQILKFNADGELLLKWGLPGKGPGEFDKPTDVLVMYDGNVLVSDTGNNRIQKFTGNGVFITEWGVGGSENAALHRPQQISEGLGQMFYVADAGSNRIQIIHQRDPIHLYGPKPSPYPTAKQPNRSEGGGDSMLDEFSSDGNSSKADAKKDKDAVDTQDSKNLRDSAVGNSDSKASSSKEEAKSDTTSASNKQDKNKKAEDNSLTDTL